MKMFLLILGLVYLTLLIVSKIYSRYYISMRNKILDSNRLNLTQINYFLQTRDKMYVEIEKSRGKFIQGILWVDDDGLVNIQSGGKVFPYKRSTGKEDILQLAKVNIAKLYRYSTVDEMTRRGFVVGV